MKLSTFYRLRQKKTSPPVSDEKVEGLLVNVFGINLPGTEAPAASCENRGELEKEEGLLANVFGVKLPADGVSSSKITNGFSKDFPSDTKTR